MTFATLSNLLDHGFAGLRSASLGMPELLVVLVIVVVIFGATKLPQLGKGLGEAIRNFKKAQKEAEQDEVDVTPRLEGKANQPVDAQLEPKEKETKERRS